MRNFPRLILTTSILCWLTISLAAPGESLAQDKWYRGNIHTHSLWSDGDDFPEMIVDWYHKNAYDFLALSDHNILMEGERWMNEDAIVGRAGTEAVIDKYNARFGDDWVERREHNGKMQYRLKTLAEFRPKFEQPGKFLLIQGEEVTDGFEGKPVHINATNLREYIPPQKGDSVRDTMRNNFRAIQAQEKKLGIPILGHLNHPNFGWAVTAEDLAHVVEERFFEVYNGHPGINHRGDDYRPGDERMWDIANTIRLAELKAQALYGIGTDDSHNYHKDSGSITGKGWVMVRAKELSPEALIHAMRAGDFYASSGVTLKDIVYDRDAKTLTVEVDPAKDATYTITFIGTRKNYDPTSEAATDATGRPLDATRVYSDDIGEVLAVAHGTKATYKLHGDELYVRARVDSSLPPERPNFDDQVKQAWTQPVGWR